MAFPRRSLLALALVLLAAPALAGCNTGDTALSSAACRSQCAVDFNSRVCRRGSTCSNTLFESTCCREGDKEDSCGLGECYCSVDKIKGSGVGILIAAVVALLLLVLCVCCVCCMLFKKRKRIAQSAKAATQGRTNATEDQARMDVLNESHRPSSPPAPEVYAPTDVASAPPPPPPPSGFPATTGASAPPPPPSHVPQFAAMASAPSGPIYNAPPGSGF